MNNENRKTNEPHKLRLTLADKLNLEDPNKNMALANLNMHYTWKNIKSAYNNDKFKVSASTLNDNFNFPDGSYSIFDIQDYFEYIIKKHETIVDSPPVQIYVNKIKNRVVFKIKTGCKLELLSEETMKVSGNSKKAVDKNNDGESVPKLESVKVVLVHCNLVNNIYQQAYKVLFTFVPNKQFGQLINISPHTLIMLNTNTEFSFIEVWFTDQNSKQLEIEDNGSITLIIGTE